MHGADVDPRELALQIVDIVALRPEVELCYMGVANKCFEILENKNGWDARPESLLGQAGNDLSSSEPEDEGDDGADDDPADDDDDDDNDDDDDDDDDGEDDADDTESEASGGSSGSDAAEENNHARLRLREILFYDDKVAVFRARHGRL